jgi:hypothetical protein
VLLRVARPGAASIWMCSEVDECKGSMNAPWSGGTCLHSFCLWVFFSQTTTSTPTFLL